jgi:hypothetical protein
MIVYYGIPRDEPDRPGRIVRWKVSGREGPGRAFDLRKMPWALVGDADGLDWGVTTKTKLPNGVEVDAPPLSRPGGDALALVLCAGVVDEHKARAVYKRFRERIVDRLPGPYGHPQAPGAWAISEDEIGRVIEKIEEDGTIAAADISRQRREREPHEHEGGVSGLGARIAWDTDVDGRQTPGSEWAPAPFRRR